MRRSPKTRRPEEILFSGLGDTEAITGLGRNMLVGVDESRQGYKWFPQEKFAACDSSGSVTDLQDVSVGDHDSHPLEIATQLANCDEAVIRDETTTERPTQTTKLSLPCAQKSTWISASDHEERRELCCENCRPNIDGTHVYYANAGLCEPKQRCKAKGALAHRSLANGAQEPLSGKFGCISAVAVNGSAVYFLYVGQILTVPKSGGTVTAVWSGPRDDRELAVDDARGSFMSKEKIPKVATEQGVRTAECETSAHTAVITSRSEKANARVAMRLDAGNGHALDFSFFLNGRPVQDNVHLSENDEITAESVRWSALGPARVSGCCEGDSAGIADKVIAPGETWTKRCWQSAKNCMGAFELATERAKET